MYYKSLTNLSKLPILEVQQFIASFDTVLTDCDGVLWLENIPIQNSVEVLNELRALGKKIFYVTNNSTKVKEDFLLKAKNLGFIAYDEEMLATSTLAAKYLHDHNVKKAYVIGSTGISQELEKLGIDSFGVGPDVLPDNLSKYIENFVPEPNVQAVVVGFDAHISYVKLLKASSYLANPDCLYVATNTDESFPARSGLIIPGTGTFVAAVSTCSGREPTIMGKPNPNMVKDIIKKFNIEPSRTLMIGDRCNTDILLGTNCGFQTLMVLSGVATLEETTNWKTGNNEEYFGLVPDVYLDKLGDLLPFLK